MDLQALITHYRNCLNSSPDAILIGEIPEGAESIPQEVSNWGVPAYSALKENLHKIGKIRRVVAEYCQHSSRYEDYKKGDIKNAFKREFSNGSLMDIGIYSLFFVLSLFDIPESINATGLVLENGKGIDGQGIINMNYKDMDYLS